MEILRKIAFYVLVVALPLEAVFAIFCMFKKDVLAEILRLVRIIITVWILAGLYFGSMIF